MEALYAVSLKVHPAVVAPNPAERGDAARSGVRRWSEVLGFWALWLALGLGLKPDPNLYLMLGIPLTLAFQLGIRRRPVSELWLRGSDHAPLNRAVFGVALAVLGAVAVRFGWKFATLGEWTHLAWAACVLAGAFPAARALARLGRSGWSVLARASAVLAVVGGGQFVLAAAARAAMGKAPLHFDLQVAVVSFLGYLAVTFVLEEVSFRGLIDSHVHVPGGRRPIVSALAVGALWGLWHLPIIPAEARHPGPVMAVMVIHAVIGLPLSWAWRRTGNLAAPAFAHSLADAIRNGLGLMG